MKNTKIEWCDNSWNPVTGCKHGCEYCYARRMANRFYTAEFEGFENLANGELKVLCKPVRDKKGRVVPYPYCFEPTFHRYRLNEPQRIKKPSNIFVCSMADLFGDWVPDEWIKEVFEACEAAHQHRYLFLTKNPKRYSKLASEGKLPHRNNFWYGSTITSNNKQRFVSPKCDNPGYNTFLSIEPLLNIWDFNPYGEFDSNKWVIIGAETGNRKGKVIPKLEWIEKIVDQCKAAGVPVFMKDSLKGIWQGELIREFPWEVEGL